MEDVAKNVELEFDRAKRQADQLPFGDKEWYHEKIEILEQEYKLEILPLLIKGKKEDYMRMLEISGMIDSILSLTRELGLTSFVSSRPGMDFSSYTGDSNDDLQECSNCKVPLESDGNEAELYCPLCGMSYELQGITLDVQSAYAQESRPIKISKSGNHKPTHHFQQWLDRVLSQGIPENSERYSNVVQKIKEIAKEENRNIKKLTIIDIRSYLQRIKCQDMYNWVSSILKDVSGISPPPIPIEKRFEAELLFDKILRSREKVCSMTYKNGKPNHPYYPYYIYKIFDLILDKNDPCRKILFYIHLQGSNTLEKNDTNWKLICDDLDLEWRPTTSFDQQQYMP